MIVVKDMFLTHTAPSAPFYNDAWFSHRVRTRLRASAWKLGQSVSGACRVGTTAIIWVTFHPFMVPNLSSTGPLRAKMRYAEDLGSHAVLTASLHMAEIRIVTPFGMASPAATDLRLNFAPDRLHLFDASGRRIAAALTPALVS